MVQVAEELWRDGSIWDLCSSVRFIMSLKYSVINYYLEGLTVSSLCLPEAFWSYPGWFLTFWHKSSTFPIRTSRCLPFQQLVGLTLFCFGGKDSVRLSTEKKWRRDSVYGVKDKATLTLREGNSMIIKLWVLNQDKLPSNFFQAASSNTCTWSW